jgi:hypothetical protein
VQEPTPLMVAVLSALAGVRFGQAVLLVGASPTLARVLEAGCGQPLVAHGPADVAVALTGPDVPDAVEQARPGGRIVGLAADLGAVERTVALHGLELRHTEVVGNRTAWSATRHT